MAYLIRKITDEPINANYPNLKKQQYITTFKKHYPTSAEILKNQYGLTDEDKIIVLSTTQSFSYKKKNYRSKFKKEFSGTVANFEKHILNYFETKIWKRASPKVRLKRLTAKWRRELEPQYYDYERAYSVLKGKYPDEEVKEYLKQERIKSMKTVKEIVEKRKKKVLDFIKEKDRFPHKKELKSLIPY